VLTVKVQELWDWHFLLILPLLEAARALEYASLGFKDTGRKNPSLNYTFENSCFKPIW
jgi:hypothetical protein